MSDVKIKVKAVSVTKVEYVIQQLRHYGWTDIHKESNINDVREGVRLLKKEILKYDVKYRIVLRTTTDKVIEG